MNGDGLNILVLTTFFPNRTDVNRGIYVFRQTKELSFLCSIDIVAPVAFFEKLQIWIRKGIQINSVEHIDGLDIRHPVYFHMPGMFRNINGLFMFLSLYLFIKRRHMHNKWNAIVSHFVYPDGFFSVIVGKLLGIPVFVTCLGSDINVLTERLLTKKFVAWTLKQSAKVFVVSESLGKKIIDMGINEKNVFVINNGIDVEKFYLMDRFNIKKELGYCVDDKILLYVGRLSKEKGVDVLIKSLPLMNGHNVKLMIAGGGPHGNYLKNLSRRLGLSEKIQFLGPLPSSEIPRLMNAADLFILPSHSEGYPNVLLEALACGIPALATRVGGVPEILVDENLGIIVPPGDPIRMAQGIEVALGKGWDREYLRNSVQFQTWGENARKTLNAIMVTLNEKDFLEGRITSC